VREIVETVRGEGLGLAVMVISVVSSTTVDSPGPSDKVSVSVTSETAIGGGPYSQEGVAVLADSVMVRIDGLPDPPVGVDSEVTPCGTETITVADGRVTVMMLPLGPLPPVEVDGTSPD
jgi:hypothetical protein